MKITGIKQQVKRQGRYSVFVDEKYSFSLSAEDLLEQKLANGDELSQPRIAELTRLSGDSKVYDLVLRYLALRPRTRWEIVTYLERRHSPAPLIEQITNKLDTLDLIDDRKFAKSFVNDRRLLRPTSRRKITIELRKKHVSSEDIEVALGSDTGDEQAALRDIIARKRRQTRYQDDMKLMQYLAGQGFNYSDIKNALQVDETE